MIRPVTPQEMADGYGVTLDEYRADRLGLLARSLAERSGQPHGIFRSPQGEVVYSLTMGEAMGYPLIRVP